MTLLAEVVAASTEVGATRSRRSKVATLAGLLSRLDPGEVATVVAFLAGEPRQGKVGVGWRTLAAIEVEPAPTPALTVNDLDVTLDRLLAVAGPGSAGTRTELLTDLLARATADEGRFVFRLLTGELRQGALEGVMVDAVAAASGAPLAAVRRAVMLSGDLGATAATARAEGESGLAAARLTLLQPVQPMLASTADDVAAALDATGKASVEWKLDGARIQVHRSGPDVAVFTRNGNEVTGRLPAVVAATLELPVSTVILDGEALGVDAERVPLRFQETMSRFGRHRPGDDSGERPLWPFLFDVLHLDGRDLLDEPLAVRREALTSVAGDWLVPGTITDDVEVAAGVLGDALASGHEGVMVKSVESSYAAGRRGGAWLKVKPVTTLDLVVLAAEWGHGRRRGWLSNLHLGARDPGGDGFWMVGKTFKGLTDGLLTWQTEALLARAADDQGWMVTVRPELVVEVAIDGVQRSTRYAGGVALRFARVRRYRDDKTPADADTIDAVRSLLG